MPIFNAGDLLDRIYEPPLPEEFNSSLIERTSGEEEIEVSPGIIALGATRLGDPTPEQQRNNKLISEVINPQSNVSKVS